MHDEIKRFGLEGDVGDVNLVEAKARMLHFIETQMADEGFVPVLDLEPQFTLDYQPDTETYKFEVSVYGIHVGREECKGIVGFSIGSPVRRSTPSPK